MRKYDSVTNRHSYQELPEESDQSPGTPRSRRKSRLSMISSTLNEESRIMANDMNGHDLLNPSFRRRSTSIGSSRMDTFGALLVKKDDDTDQNKKIGGKSNKTLPSNIQNESPMARLIMALHQIPAIALIGIFHLMVGIPFGVSYFPMYWSSHPGDMTSTETLDDEVSSIHEIGKFPIPGKEALGIRMFLFSTIVGQVVFAFYSGFKNPIGLQMVENIGFTKELAQIAISHQGFGVEALSTVMVMFGLASLMVGFVFFLLGKFKMGKVVYFFPTHVLIGLIGGIGILLCKTGLENTLAKALTIRSFVEGWNLWIVVAILELILRILEYATTDSKGKPRFALLSPIFFCMITPGFYLTLWILKIHISESRDAGYFFPPLNSDFSDSDSSLSTTFGTPWDLWKVIDFSSVSWMAILESLPTMVALILFSLIHVPINIPAFALSSKVDADMNQELIAHGISNMLAGSCGGLQNYLAYTQSVLYDKSGGSGRLSGLAVAAVTCVLFFVGPTIASHIPRCMAGTLLLHVGIDLFLEGVWDSYGKFDLLEYAGIWLIVIVMSVYGMEAAMVAGGIAAVSTYAVQNVAYLSPIRGVMPATTLRSSDWNRNAASEAILVDSETGRSRILVVQLQGHLFFGNIAFFTDQIDELLSPTKEPEGNEIEVIHEEERTAPLVLVMDFSLVLGIDSSAAHAIVKLKDTILKEYHIKLCLFVPGSDEGFPTEFDLKNQLSQDSLREFAAELPKEDTSLLAADNEDEELQNTSKYNGSRVCDSLDIALMEAEDALIARQNPSLVKENDALSQSMLYARGETFSSDEEREEFICAFQDLCTNNVSNKDAIEIFSSFEREVFREGEMIWKQDDESDSVKILILGQLIAELENEAGTTEIIPRGSMIGELGLVNGNPRMSTVRCLTKEAVLFSMSRVSFDELISKQPHLARHIDLICVKYLALRVQHVSNRIFETRCLPI